MFKNEEIGNYQAWGCPVIMAWAILQSDTASLALPMVPRASSAGVLLLKFAEVTRVCCGCIRGGAV